jgi:hypothetical protein
LQVPWLSHIVCKLFGCQMNLLFVNVSCGWSEIVRMISNLETKFSIQHGSYEFMNLSTFFEVGMGI